MAQTSTNVVFSKPKATGALSRATYGTKLPTDATSGLDNAFKSLGYINEDGVNENHDLSSESVKDYGKTTVLVVDGGDDITVDFTLLEYTNPEVQKVLYGDDHVVVDGTELKAVKISDDAKEICPYVAEHVLSNGIIERDVIPRAKVTGIDTIPHNADGAISVKVTLTCVADDDGVKIYKYFASPTASANTKE